MKKSSFVAIVLGTIGGILFSLGMCMSLVPEWGTGRYGAVFGAAGLAIILLTVFVWRRMEHKPPVKLSGKSIGTVLLGTAGTLLLGVGMCLAMLWGQMIFGIVVGIIGIVLLIGLIPFIMGIKE